jgi:hypothetical protein
MTIVQSNSNQFAVPLSSRAAQMLHELQGQKLLNREIPVMNDAVSSDTTAPVNFKKNKVSPEFRKQDYLDETRTSFLGKFILTILVFIIVLFLSIWGVFFKLKPELQSLHKNGLVLSKLSYELNAVSQEISRKTEALSQTKEQFEDLLSLYPDQDTIYSVYTKFLSGLEDSKNSVLSQTGTISQSHSNPFLQETQAEIAKEQNTSAPEVKGVNADKKKTSPDSSAQKNATSQANSKKPESPLNVIQPIKINGEIKAGLNYYHLKFKFEGSYVGYLTARQSLINDNPAMIVHFEDIRLSPTDPTKMVMTVLYSIPFYSLAK